MNRDYDLAICKVPRYDKYGKDITRDKIGIGGRHRDNGTYSGPVYDIKVIKEGYTDNINTDYTNILDAGKQPKENSIFYKIIENVASEIVVLSLFELYNIVKNKIKELIELSRELEEILSQFEKKQLEKDNDKIVRFVDYHEKYTSHVINELS